MPLADEGIGSFGGWLRPHAAETLKRVRARVRSRLRVRLGDGAECGVDGLTFEESALEGLLTEQDQETLRPGKRAVPTRFRDGGRWRDALEALASVEPIRLTDALQSVALGRRNRPCTRVGLARAAGRSSARLGTRGGAVDSPWLRLSDGRRLSPDEVASGGTLLVHRADATSLAGRLGVAHAIASVYLRSDPSAKRVRQWLHEQRVLRARPNNSDALSALARGDGESPVDLSSKDGVLVQLRDAFEALPNEERDSLGEGIGRNIALAGREFDENGKAREVTITPSQSYLPNAIDKSEGWSTAAARTPGIRWVDRRYADVLRADGRMRLGALAFLRKLGCQMTVRLEPVSDPAPWDVRLSRPDLPVHQQIELSGVPRVDVLLDDWVAPDLDRVLENLMNERTATARRRRARALFVGLNRAWAESYADRATAVPAYYQRRWHHYEHVSATWIARLASVHGSTTRDGAPPEGTARPPHPHGRGIRSCRSEDPSLYADELDEDFADTPLAEALGVAGRPRASELLDLLEEFREHDQSGDGVEQRRVQRCYDSLARYCPGGAEFEQSDVPPNAIRVRSDAARARLALSVTARAGSHRHGRAAGSHLAIGFR